MIQKILRRFMSLALSAVLVVTLLPVISTPALAAVSGTLTGLSNEDIVATYTGTDEGANSSWSVTGGNSINGSVIGTAGMCSDSHYNTTLTITNNKPTAAILSFDYAIAQNSGSIQVAGTTVTANGSYSGTIEAGSSINIYIGSGSTDNATTIDITNLFLIADVQATTTFQPAENGSYMVDGAQITEETVKIQQSTVAYNLSAEADAGYKFVGWYSITDDKYLSSDEEASLYIDSDQTLTAIFTEESNPVFDVGGAKFTDLNEADNYASSNGIEKITLVSDGILASGDYTISDGVILLIPFDDAYTCYTTAPATTGNVRTSPSVYKKLTMDKDASITVNGAISVSAKHYAYSQGGAAGAPDGKYGYIFMNEGSSITVNNGGALYVYGFISGDGTVTAKSGATVYENMQIADFRGGTATMGMYNNSQKIFPLNQYFIQNIEAKLVLESGADEYIYTSIYASNMSTSTAVHFIGNTDAMFSVSEGGSLIKEYLPDQDRLEMTINGDATLNSLTLSLSGMSVTSANYVLPINNAITINVASGTTQITQDVALLAGSQINIAKGATLQVTQGSSLYVYDSTEWTQANYASNAKFKRVPYSPTRTYTRTNNDLVDVKIEVNGTLRSDGSVYTTAGGADIVSSQDTGKVILTNGAGTNTATYMYKDYTTNYDTIRITSAKLHNGEQYVGTDEEYTLTDGAAPGSTYYWCTSCSKWNDCEHFYVTVVVDGEKREGDKCRDVKTNTDDDDGENDAAEIVIDNIITAPESVTFNGDPMTLLNEDQAVQPNTYKYDAENGTLTVYVGGSGTVTVVTQAVAQIVDSAGAVSRKFATLAEAITAYQDTGYIQLTNNVTEEFVTIDRDVYLDLAGYDVNGEVTITGGGTLYGMDSTTDNYNGENAGTITTVTGTPVAVFQTDDIKCDNENEYYRYVAIQDNDGGYSFHRFNISVTGYRFELATSTPECALFFIAQFRGDDLVRNQLKKIEITMTEGEDPITGPWIDFEDGAENDERLNQTEDGFQFEAYLVRAFSGENADRYTVPITASSTATFANGWTQKSEPREITYLKAWKEVTEITDDQRLKLKEFLAGLQNGDGTE